MNIIVPHNFEPREYQLPVFQALERGIRRILLRWCRRSGKDKTCLNVVAKRMMERVGGYYYVLPTYAQGRKIIWEGRDRDGFRVLDHIHPDLRASTNGQEMLVTLKNGSYFRVIGADSDKIDKLVGTNPVMLVLSEFAVGQDYAHVLDLFRPILRENDGILLINSTPRGRNHMFELEERVKDNPNWFVSAIQTMGPDYTGGGPECKYYPIVSPEAIEEDIKEGMDPEKVEQEYGVSYSATTKGRVYEEYFNRALEEGRVGHYPEDSHRWVDVFFDLGYDDSTAMVFRQLHGDSIRIIDYYEDSGKDIAFYVQKLIEKGYRYRNLFLPHDGGHHSIHTGQTTKQIFEDLIREAPGIRPRVIVCPRLSVMDGINGTRKLFNRMFFNDATTKDLQDCIINYRFKYDQKRDILMKEPVHDWTSHACDALRQMTNAEETEEELLRRKYQKIKSISRFN